MGVCVCLCVCLFANINSFITFFFLPIHYYNMYYYSLNVVCIFARSLSLFFRCRLFFPPLTRPRRFLLLRNVIIVIVIIIITIYREQVVRAMTPDLGPDTYDRCRNSLIKRYRCFSFKRNVIIIVRCFGIA